MGKNYTVQKKNDMLVVRMKYKAGWKQSFLLTSDEHYDNKKCDRKALKKHLDEAKENNWGWISFGDFYDCMGGKWDKRSSKKDIRPEYNKGWYFDEVRKDVVKFIKPYSGNLIQLTEGNHEASIKLRNEFDILDQTVGQLNKIEGNNINYGKYQGWIRFVFEHEGGGAIRKYDLWYTHGTGGNAPVTRGAIQSARRQDMVRADFYVAGHIHTGYELPRPTVILDSEGHEKIIEAEHLQLGTYKQSWNGAWESQKGFSPAVIGGRVLEFYMAGKQIKYRTWRIKK